MFTMTKPFAAAIAVGCAIVFSGCVARPNLRLMQDVRDGEYADAREEILDGITTVRTSRNYLLDQMRLVLVDVYGGMYDLARDECIEIFDILRTQGINADNTVASVVINEDIKYWKGEPFEQAMMFSYIATVFGIAGDWDNARAAAQSSLFLLRDFGANSKGVRKSTQDIASEAVVYEKQHKSDEYLSSGYVAVESDFALGYFLAGLANWNLNRDQEAIDYFNVATQLKPRLSAVVASITDGSANTVLLVESGFGPQKVAYGPDNALAKFQKWESEPVFFPVLQVWVAGEHLGQFPDVCDLNQMASDHMWNNLEDVRLAKSRLGDALIVSGALVSSYSRDEAGAYAGLAMMLVGIIQKAGAHADTRYCEVLPERMYVAPLRLDDPTSRVSLKVNDRDPTQLTIVGIRPPSMTERVALRHVRLNYGEEAPAWATAGTVEYKDDQYLGRVIGSELPFILGGRCVRTPSASVLFEYQQAGYLTGFTVADLQNLYRAEGISLSLEEEQDKESRREGSHFRHILEGGGTLVSPSIGTAGYQRVFGQTHPSYKPKSDEVKTLFEDIAAQRTSGSSSN